MNIRLNWLINVRLTGTGLVSSAPLLSSPVAATGFISIVSEVLVI